EECLARGLREVRFIHGKGIGVQRTIVQEILAAHPEVEAFGHPSDASGWGATVASLRPREGR
ncbi:Smr/MutS family protein, partial [bacterium]|nr:Smr/MutS family protein [bacterium]